MEILAEAEVELDGTFDEVAAVGGVVKEAALKDGLDEETEVKVTGGPEVAKGTDVVGMREVAVGQVEF